MTLFISLVIIVILSAVAAVALLGIWTYKDAKNRGLNASLWTIVVLAGQNLTGLLIYLIIGRKGTIGGVAAKKYIIGIVAAFIIMIAGIIGIVVYSVSGDFDGFDISYSTGMMQYSWGDKWDMSFNYSNGTFDKTIRVPENEIKTLYMSGNSEEGVIEVILIQSESSEIYNLSKIGETQIILQSGRYKLIVVNHNVKNGKINIYWE